LSDGFGSALGLALRTMPGVAQLDQVSGADGIDLDPLEQAPTPGDRGFEGDLAAGGVL